MAILKAQSAMEYLMTYGWAILLIAVVLSILFGLGLFNSSSNTISNCIASPGFICTGAIYSHSDANIIVTLGQETGTSWVSANFVFVPEQTPMNSNGVPAVFQTASAVNTVLANSGMQSGGEQNFYLPVNSIPMPVAIGTPVLGSIWAEYTYSYSSSGVYHTGTSYAQIATLNLKAS